MPIKDSENFRGQTDLTKQDIQEVFMQTAEPVSTREATEGVVKKN